MSSVEALRQLRFSTLLRFAKTSKKIRITLSLVSLGLRRFGPELQYPRWVESTLLSVPCTQTKDASFYAARQFQSAMQKRLQRRRSGWMNWFVHRTAAGLFGGHCHLPREVIATNADATKQRCPKLQIRDTSSILSNTSTFPLFLTSRLGSGVNGSLTLGGWIDAKGKVSWGTEVTLWGTGAKTQWRV